MGHDEYLEDIYGKLRKTRSLLEEIKRMSSSTAPTFSDVLMREKQRAQRYNHYFSVVLLTPDEVDALDLLKRTTRLLRGSDVVGLVDAQGRYHRAAELGQGIHSAPRDAPGERWPSVGVVLPETDRQGAQRAVLRLESVLLDAARVKIGLAVYPEDGTDPDELIQRAAA